MEMKSRWFETVLIMFCAGVVFGVIFAGCYSEPPMPGKVYEKPYQSEAVKIAWTNQFPDTPSEIHWVEGDELDPTCVPQPTWRNHNGDCVDGMTTPYGMSIAWDSTMVYSRSAMAHEFAHREEFLITNDLDENHIGFLFKSSYIQDTNKLLSEVGL